MTTVFIALSVLMVLRFREHKRERMPPKEKENNHSESLDSADINPDVIPHNTGTGQLILVFQPTFNKYNSK